MKKMISNEINIRDVPPVPNWFMDRYLKDQNAVGKSEPEVISDEVREIIEEEARQAVGAKHKFSDEEDETRGFYRSLREMFAADIPEKEEIVLGLGRGEVGMLISVTNAGKTTLMQNLSLSLAAGQPLPPLTPDALRPFRVLYCDFESPDYKFVRYVKRMLSTINRREIALDNFIPLADALLCDQPLDIGNPRHFEYLRQHAVAIHADLIVIDTITAAFDLKDENSNAEVTAHVMKPLKKLARETDAALIFCHHSGKPGDSLTAEKAYAGRGASAFGGLCRAIYLLRPDRKRGDDYVVLECAKIKGHKFDPILLRRDPDRAWFEPCIGEKPSLDLGLTTKEVADFVNDKGEVKRKDIIDYFKDRVSEETVDRRLEDALNMGRIEKKRKGVFQRSGKVIADALNEAVASG